MVHQLTCAPKMMYIGTGYSEPQLTAGCMKTTVTTQDIVDVTHIASCHIGPELPMGAAG